MHRTHVFSMENMCRNSKLASKMADDLQKVDEPVFTINISDLIPIEELDQTKSDELKYLEVPDDVWRVIKHNLEALPPLKPVVQNLAENQENLTNENQFVDVTEDNLDDIASENSATNTKIQTRWALKTFRGRIFILHKSYHNY